MPLCAPQFGQYHRHQQQAQQTASKQATEESRRKDRPRLRPTAEKYNGYTIFVRLDDGRKVYSNGRAWLAMPDNPQRDQFLAEQGKIEQLARTFSSRTVSDRKAEESARKKSPAEAVSSYARYVMSEAKNSGASPHGMVIAILEIGGWEIDPDDHGDRGTSTVLVHAETGGRVEVFGAVPQEAPEISSPTTHRKNRKVHGKKYAHLSEAEIAQRREMRKATRPRDRKLGKKGDGGKGKK